MISALSQGAFTNLQCKDRAFIEHSKQFWRFLSGRLWAGCEFHITSYLGPQDREKKVEKRRINV